MTWFGGQQKAPAHEGPGQWGGHQLQAPQYLGEKARTRQWGVHGVGSHFGLLVAHFNSAPRVILLFENPSGRLLWSELCLGASLHQKIWRQGNHGAAIRVVWTRRAVIDTLAGPWYNASAFVTANIAESLAIAPSKALLTGEVRG